MIRPLGHLRDGPQGSATAAVRPLAVREERTMKTAAERAATGAAWLVSREATELGFDIRRINAETLHLPSGEHCPLGQAAPGDADYSDAMDIIGSAGVYDTPEGTERYAHATAWALNHGFLWYGAPDYWDGSDGGMTWDEAAEAAEADMLTVEATWRELLTRA